MTTLAIMATYEKKRLKCYGTVAAGEHVAVTVTDGAQWIGEGKALRLRVLFGPDTVGVFPLADGDAWRATGTQNADAYCELNLNTLQAEKYLKHGGTCLWILDDVENHTLYATGEFDVLPWPKRRGIDEPIDLDGYPLLLDEIKDLKEAFEEYQRTVAQALAAKQDTIFDLATIRSGAAAGATAVQPSQIARFVDDAEYKAQYGEQNKPAILFKHGTNVIVALDATPFVRDGMVSSVEIEDGKLVITFNTDAGQEPIEIPLTDIFDPANYYDKTAADGKFVAKEVGKGLSTEDYTTAEKTKLGGIAAGAQVNVIETVKVNGTALTPQDKAVNIPVLTLDNTVTRNSANGVKSSGIWSAIWGTASTEFSSLYDWCVSQLAGKLDTSSAAPIFTAKTYAVNDLCTYNGVIYRCKVGYTATASSTKPDADTTHWEAKPVSDLFLRAAHLVTEVVSESRQFADVPGVVVFNPNGVSYLSQLSEQQLITLLQNGGVVDAFGNAMCFPTRSATSNEIYDFALTAGPNHTGNLAALDEQGNPTDSTIPAANVAVKGEIPYILVTKTISNNAVTLDDRASNAVTISATLSPNTLTINFPTAPTGKLRDFAMRLNIAAGVTAPEIAWPQGVTLENNGGEVPEIADGGTGGSSTILYFSETENNGTTAKFLVKSETLAAITQA